MVLSNNEKAKVKKFYTSPNELILSFFNIKILVKKRPIYEDESLYNILTIKNLHKNISQDK